MTDTPVSGTIKPPMRDETDMEHIARDIREGRFPKQSPRQQAPAAPANATDTADIDELIADLRQDHEDAAIHPPETPTIYSMAADALKAQAATIAALILDVSRLSTSLSEEVTEGERLRAENERLAEAQSTLAGHLAQALSKMLKADQSAPDVRNLTQPDIAGGAVSGRDAPDSLAKANGNYGDPVSSARDAVAEAERILRALQARDLGDLLRVSDEVGISVIAGILAKGPRP